MKVKRDVKLWLLAILGAIFLTTILIQKILSENERNIKDFNFSHNVFYKLNTTHPWGTTFSSLRIFCLVHTYDEHAHVIPTIYRFWGKHCHKLILGVTSNDTKFKDFSKLYPNVEVWNVSISDPKDQAIKNAALLHRAMKRIDESNT